MRAASALPFPFRQVPLRGRPFVQQGIVPEKRIVAFFGRRAQRLFPTLPWMVAYRTNNKFRPAERNLDLVAGPRLWHPISGNPHAASVSDADDLCFPGVSHIVAPLPSKFIVKAEIVLSTAMRLVRRRMRPRFTGLTVADSAEICENGFLSALHSARFHRLSIWNEGKL